MGKHEEAKHNCEQAVELLDQLIEKTDNEEEREEARWKLAVGLNNLGVEHQYLAK